MKKNGFTLIELLVVISIIALLVGLLLPALGKVRKTGQALDSLSNVRQWGVAQLTFAHDNKEFLAWDGEDYPNSAMPAASGYTVVHQAAYWWANALPPYLQKTKFYDMTEPALPGGEKHIFVDQAAQTPDNWPGALAPTGYRYNHITGGQRSFFFCYVPNSKLDSNGPSFAGVRRSLLRDIEKPSITALMLEMRTVRDEIRPTHPNYATSLNRAKGDWQRFAARHQNGGHILFGDGHGEQLRHDDVTTKPSHDYVTGGLNAGWNSPDIIWNPLGAAN